MTDNKTSNTRPEVVLRQAEAHETTETPHPLTNTTHPLLRQDSHTHTSSHTRSHTNTTEFLPCRAFCHWRQTALHRGTRKKGLWLDIVENENPSR